MDICIDNDTVEDLRHRVAEINSRMGYEVGLVVLMEVLTMQMVECGLPTIELEFPAGRFEGALISRSQ